MDAILYSKTKKMSPQLIVADIKSSIGFYTKKLGFEIDFIYEDFYSGISKDGFSIHLKVGKPSMEDRQNRRNNGDIDRIYCITIFKSFIGDKIVLLIDSDILSSSEGMFM